MTRLIYLLFGKRVGRIVAGVIFLLLGILYIGLNLSDPTLTDSKDWIYCVILLVAGVGFLAFGILSKDKNERVSARDQGYQPPINR
ncbi:hypothetical protein [Ktedonospora formicarum]|uniref:Uncharacterized protein n=1 Tax=Ktedonospora formicarum TaxID=2778364 RepID=A0A8J3I2R9_9CHLR|nr:hypothetical protein [Ktedonospora formicarum]GHO48254.1 hypothetical protein KSX_64170 [Ktedonospora formicarum]